MGPCWAYVCQGGMFADCGWFDVPMLFLAAELYGQRGAPVCCWMLPSSIVVTRCFLINPALTFARNSTRCLNSSESLCIEVDACRDIVNPVIKPRCIMAENHSQYFRCVICGGSLTSSRLGSKLGGMVVRLSSDSWGGRQGR